MSSRRSGSRTKNDQLKAREEGFSNHLGGANEFRAKEKNKILAEKDKSIGSKNRRESKERMYKEWVQPPPPQNSKPVYWDNKQPIKKKPPDNKVNHFFFNIQIFIL